MKQSYLTVKNSEEEERQLRSCKNEVSIFQDIKNIVN